MTAAGGDTADAYNGLIYNPSVWLGVGSPPDNTPAEIPSPAALPAGLAMLCVLATRRRPRRDN